jgi:hypothetical protein
MHTPPSNQLVFLDEAAQLLDKARSFDDIKAIRDKAEAVRIYVKAAKMGLELQNRAAELKLCAERKAGTFLSTLRLQGGDRRSKGHRDPLKLEDLGVSRNESKRWQLASTVPECEFRQYLNSKTSLGEEVTAAGLLKLARYLRKDGKHNSPHPLGEGNGKADHRNNGQKIEDNPFTLIEELREHRKLLAQILEPICEMNGHEMNGQANGHVIDSQFKRGERRAIGHLLREMADVMDALERKIVGQRSSTD